MHHLRSEQQRLPLRRTARATEFKCTLMGRGLFFAIVDTFYDYYNIEEMEMSDMEIFYGYFSEEENQNIQPSDTDEFLDFEKRNNCIYVKVDGVVYKVWEIDARLDCYGFSIVIPPSDVPRLVLYWYNGGASLKEVAESSIRNYVKER